MRAGEGGAPARAAGTYPAARYYGLRWRARDMARQARRWPGKGIPMWLRAVGAAYVLTGMLMILATAVVPGLRQYPGAPCLGGGALVFLGYACVHEKRRVP